MTPSAPGAASGFGVVVLSYRGAPDTLECVGSLAEAEPRPGRILVVDNGSGDGSAEAFRERFAPLPGVSVLALPANLGYAGGMNRGAEALLAEGKDVILLLNNDTVVERGFLPPLLACLAKGGEASIATPRILYPDGKTLWSLGERVFYPLLWSRRVRGRPDGTPWPPRGGINAVTGCAMAVRREVFERIGLLDEAYFAYVEEVDFCKRARDAGFRFAACPASVVIHKEARALGESSPAQRYLKARNRTYFFRKNAPPAVRPLSQGFNLAVLAAWWLAARARGRKGVARAIVRGVGDGLRGKMGVPDPGRFAS